MAKIEVKLFDVLCSIPPRPPEAMLAFYAPTLAEPAQPRAALRGSALLLKRRAGEDILFRLKPETARFIATAGAVLFSEVGRDRDYLVPLSRVADLPPAPIAPLWAMTPK